MIYGHELEPRHFTLKRHQINTSIDVESGNFLPVDDDISDYAITITSEINAKDIVCLYF